MSQDYGTGEQIQASSGNSAGGAANDIIDLDLSGRQLGDYRLLRHLGRGAMADVYLAEQGSLRRQVALKILKRELADDHTYVRRFHMEAQAAASLVQANIVQIYEVGCIDGWHYIAQEYVDGQNLSQYITRSGSPPLKMAIAIMRQVSAALCKAAERGIVHRDIKPENIMLARSGEVKVADFGLARIGGGEESLKLTQVGITMGTPLYMSPEQVEGRPLDPRSDIYSLGVTCYQMLAGQPPFRGETALSVAIQHVRTQPERLENLRPDLPPALCRIIHKMLAKDPAQRQQGPREL
ncbi:MAG TPA: serine/threonine-protein kinase, partial [Pirellulales bacterium]